ncbi:MAG: hypothetical protein K8F58_17895 [Bauldia sp.]|nr:hypothetical protein [Bauldia sp.]
MSGVLTIIYDGRGTIAFKSGAERLAGPRALQVMRETLRASGDKTRTQVRRALKDQTGVKAYGTITRYTRSYVHEGGLAYSVEGVGRGLPIDYFPVRVTGRGVSASPWRVVHNFKRSFANGGYFARLGPSRFPIRRLYGPSIAKEIVKDQALAAFLDAGPREVARILPMKMARLLP